MASEGPLSAGTGADDSSVGTIAWSNPTRVVASDNSRSSASLSGAGSISHYLKATSFGFAIPAGATIDGIVVEIEKREQESADDVKDSKVRIIKSDGTIGTTDRADTATEWGTSDAYATYGGTTDLWGEAWSSTDINDADFGVAISAVSAPGSAVADVDHIRITVYYTESTYTAAMFPFPRRPDPRFDPPRVVAY